MLHTLLTFIPVAALLSITPGAATALVVRNAARAGRREEPC
jgi:threonine/homoserine/homoserine lactone efflux protein